MSRRNVITDARDRSADRAAERIIESMVAGRELAERYKKIKKGKRTTIRLNDTSLYLRLWVEVGTLCVALGNHDGSSHGERSGYVDSEVIPELLREIRLHAEVATEVTEIRRGERSSVRATKRKTQNGLRRCVIS